MAQSPMDRVRLYYALVDSLTDEEALDRLVALFAADAVYRRPGYEPIAGHPQLRRFYGSERVIERGSHTIDAEVARDSTVAVHGTFAGVLKTGAEVSLRFADFFVVGGDGRFVRRDTFFFAPLV